MINELVSACDDKELGAIYFRYRNISLLRKFMDEVGIPHEDLNDKKSLILRLHEKINLSKYGTTGSAYTRLSPHEAEEIINKLKEVYETKKGAKQTSEKMTEESNKKDPLPEGEETEEYTVSWKYGSEVNKYWPDIPVPVFEWKVPVDGIPEKNPDYFFRKDKVEKVLYSILSNSRAYLFGHTGTGKTTLIEQIAAWLNIPFVRINFDSEISRFDLIGRDVLKIKEGTTVSEFIHGLIPSAMKRPCLACFDEIDFCRPDVAYVMQSVLEGNQLLIPENGNEIIKPHKWFRMFATGNTKGRGDSSGIYVGARVQSAALLDRFGIWIEMPFMNRVEAKKVLKDNGAAKYYEKHNKEFEAGTFSSPVTIRSMLEYVKAKKVLGKEAAFESVIIDRFPAEEKGLIEETKNRITL